MLRHYMSVGGLIMVAGIAFAIADAAETAAERHVAAAATRTDQESPDTPKGEQRSSEPAEKWTFIDPNKAALQQAHIPMDGPSIEAFLKDNSAKDSDILKLEALIRQLGNHNFEQREDASRRIIGVGAPALAYLARASANPDPEVAQRTAVCIEKIGKKANTDLCSAAVHMLLRKPDANAIPALLDYLPSAPDEKTAEEIVFGIYRLTIDSRAPHPSLVAALKNVLPVRRATAACILGSMRSWQDRKGILDLLKDQNSLVRLRATQGLLCAKDPSSIPVLIALLDEANTEISWQAEELLHWIAGDLSPTQTIGPATLERRRVCRQAWETWWNRIGPGFDWTEVNNGKRKPLLVLVFELESQGARDHLRTVLYGCDGKARFALPACAHQLLHENRLLATKVIGKDSLLCECDLLGRTQIKVRDGYSSTAQRLANGNTFVVDGQQLLDVTPTGAVLPLGMPDLKGASIGIPVRVNETTLMALSFQENMPTTIIEINTTTSKVVREAGLEVEVVPSARFELLPGGKLLLFDDGLVEVNAAGCLERRYSFGSPLSGTRLTEGHFLLSDVGVSLAEVDAEGRTWSVLSCETRPLNVLPCLGLVRLGSRSAELDADSVSYWLKQLKSSQVGLRREAVSRLGTLHPQGESAIKKLIETLGDEDAYVRAGAAIALHQIGAATLPLLAKSAGASNPRARQALIESVALFGSKARQLVPQLNRALQDPVRDVRLAAAHCLGQIGPDGALAVPALIKALGDEDRVIRTEAATALSDLGDAAASAVPALIASLKSEDLDFRVTAAAALETMGKSGEQVVRALREALMDPQSQTVRARAARSLGNIGSPARKTLPELLKLFDEADRDQSPGADLIRESVIWALGKLGKKDRSALLLLCKVLKNPQRSVILRRLAAESLGSLGINDAEAVAALVNALSENELDPYFQLCLVESIASIRPSAKLAGPVLIGILSDPKAKLRSRQAAARALGNLSDANPTLIKVLEQIVLDQSVPFHTRAEAVKALATHRLSSSSAASTLQKARKDPFCSIRTAAARALDSPRPTK